MSESGLESEIWAEAVSTAVYLLNRTPSSVIDFEIPEERWTSEVPNLSSLRRFGCIAYIHSDGGKLNPRAKKGVFTGYPEGVKGFRIWVIEDQRCVISRNVVFREDQMYKHNKAASHRGMITNSDSTDKTLSFDFVGGDVDQDMPDQGGASQEVVPTSTTEEQPQGGDTDSTSEADNQQDYQFARDRSRRVQKPLLSSKITTCIQRMKTLLGMLT